MSWQGCIWDRKMGGKAGKTFLVWISLSIGLWKCSTSISCMYFFSQNCFKDKMTYFNPFILSRWSHLPDSLFWLFSNSRGKQKFSESYVCIKGPINSSTLADYSILIGERWNLAGQESSYLESSQAEYSHFQPVSYLTSPWRWSHAVTMRCKVYIVGLDGLSSRIAVR